MWGPPVLVAGGVGRCTRKLERAQHPAPVLLSLIIWAAQHSSPLRPRSRSFSQGAGRKEARQGRESKSQPLLSTCATSPNQQRAIPAI